MSKCLALHYGKSSKPVAFVVPVDKHAGMWRIMSPDGSMSDMVNLARCKDAALEICSRGPPERDRRIFNWRKATDLSS
jgi:hypothetical protein